MECHTTLEKGSGTKSKGKLMKDIGFQPERGEQRKFGGYCNWCWQIGLKKSPVLVLTRVHEKQSISRPVAKIHS